MKLKAKIADIDYGAALEYALPLIGRKSEAREGAVGSLLRAVGTLPVESLLPVITALGTDRIESIAAEAVEEYKGRILAALTKLLDKKGIGAELEDIRLETGRELSLTLGSIDYSSIIALLLAKDEGQDSGESGKLLRTLKAAPVGTLGRILGLMSAEKKDALLVRLVNRNSDKILALINGKAGSLGLGVRVGSLELCGD